MAGIFISGGCVTRDTYESMKDEYELTAYSARQSLISAASKPTSIVGEVPGEGFEVRALQGDLDSTLFPRIAEAAPRTDLFLLDLLVERFGVLELPDGAYVTRTPNLNKSGVLGDLFLEAPHIKFGTPAHLELWRPAAEQLVSCLESSGLLGRSLLVETPWTGVTLAGEPVRPYSGWDPEETNAKYAVYYDILKGLGIRAIRLPDELVVSDENHKWGASPFHYAPATHDWLAGQVRETLA